MRFLTKWRNKEKKGRVVVLLDLENLYRNISLNWFDNFSLTTALKVILERLRDTGEIVGIFAFSPRHILFRPYQKFFIKQGIYLLLCPKITTEKEPRIPPRLGTQRRRIPRTIAPPIEPKEEVKDTTDPTLISFGKMLLREIPGLTHLCIGSGDADYLELVDKAKSKGVKVIVVAGDRHSLSADLARKADWDPKRHEKAVWILSELQRPETPNL